jgi:hypothetical protein
MDDEVLDKEDMKKVGKINPYLRDKCGVSFKDSFRFAMLIVKEKDFILEVLTGKEGESE